MRTISTLFKEAFSWCAHMAAQKFAAILFLTVCLTANIDAQVTQEWVQKFNITGDLNVRVTASAIDNDGNVYVTGYYADGVEHYNFVTVKFNSAGIKQWVRVYNNAPGWRDFANAITVDEAGNIYVTGQSRLWLYYYCITIKYDSEGTEKWVSKYSGLGNSGNAIKVDGSGNVYVAGSGSGYTSNDYITLKYNSEGTKIWAQRYNGPGSKNDVARAIALDASGNVYVTGESVGEGSPSKHDYATIKYNSAGVQQWVQRYNGPGNEEDKASAIDVDEIGNIYVTGSSKGSESGLDYATVKYNSDGVQQWIQRYNGPGNNRDEASAIAVDVGGNVYITGYCYVSGSSYDFASIKYNSDGVEQWIKRYNGPVNQSDQATSITVDGSGNVYVTGDSYGGSSTRSDYAAIKYNSEGTEQWIRRYNGPGSGHDYAISVAADPTGNVYITGYSIGSGTGFDIAVVKYASDGIEQWVGRYEQTGSTACKPYSMAVDGSGNIFIAGYNNNAGSSYDFLTLKYNSVGDQQWFRTYNGTGNSYDQAKAIIADDQGNVYVTGHTTRLGTRADYTTIKYDSEGTAQWIRFYNGPGNSSDYPQAIAVDGLGNIYVTGYCYGGPGTHYDYATVKYNSEGMEMWVQRYNGPGNTSDQATAIAVDGPGNVYVTGYFTGSGTAQDYGTLKYNSEGIMQWVATYNGPGNSKDNALTIGHDNSGNVYVTGYSTGVGTGHDYATVKYNSEGVEQWVQRYNGPGNQSDQAKKMVVDGSGNIYVTGYSTGSGTGKDYATVKYGCDGAQLWVQRYTCPGNLPDEATAITLDDWGNIYVTGKSYPSSQDNDIATIKYNSGGIEEWIIEYNDLRFIHDEPVAISADGSGYIYVTGYKHGGNMTGSIEIIKYSQILVPDAPVLISPENGSEDLSLTPLLQWNVSENATSYNLQVSGDPGFSTFVYDQTDITTTECMIPENLLSTNTPYYWRVNAENIIGTSDWSEVWHFKTYATPQDIIEEMIGIVDLYEAQGILNPGQANSLRVKLLHALSKINDGKYHEAINILQAFINQVLSFIAENILTPQQGQELIDMANEVISKLQCPDGIPTHVSRIIDPLPGIPAEYNLLQNYPNPFNSSTTIRYALPADAFVSLKVYNFFGNEVSVLVNEWQSPGAHTINFNADRLPCGIYYYRIQTGSFSATKKLIVLRN